MRSVAAPVLQDQVGNLQPYLQPSRRVTLHTKAKIQSSHQHINYSMNTEQQIRSAVANIQDELLRIIACAHVQPVERDHVTQSFRAKVTGEFNSKLRVLRSTIRQLREENARLQQRVDFLERQATHGIARPTKSLGSIPNMEPPRPYDGELVSSPDKEREDLQSLTSSQLNRLPTQYSEEDLNLPVKVGTISPIKVISPIKKGTTAQIEPLPGKFRNPRKRPRLTSSPIKANFVDEDDRIVADSQDEFEPLGLDRPAHPNHYTALQRIEFLRNYYRMKLKDVKYRVDLRVNPITEKPWVFADFKPNGNWRRPKRLNSRVGVMTKEQERVYEEFFNAAGHGLVVSGPQWDTETEKKERGTRHDKTNSNEENEMSDNDNTDIVSVDDTGKVIITMSNYHGQVHIAVDATDTTSKNGDIGKDSNDDIDNGHDGIQWVRSQVMDKCLSPPGFMMGLFPSTQEHLENKRNVAEKERRRLARRVASALSKGEFIFYEEVLNTYVAQGRYT